MKRYALLVACSLAATAALAQASRQTTAIAEAQARFRIAVQQSARSLSSDPVTFAQHSDPCTTRYLYITDWSKVRSVDFVPGSRTDQGNPQGRVHVIMDHGGVGSIPVSTDQVGPMLQAGHDLMALCKVKTASPAGATGLPASRRVEVAPCPRDVTALDKLLSGRRVISSRKEVPAVRVGDAWLFGDAGEKRYDPSGITVLGVRPAGLDAPISGGKPFSLDALLPGHDTKPYDVAFRAAFPGKRTRCDKWGCSWTSRDDTWNAPKGTLTEARTSLSILEEQYTMFTCTYR